ncbi:RING-H2 finger protein ATL79-like [Panicum hallii]|uniref:RING-H2 finger protein ATL79-like n=1 Tax=Panicum hallii TaxID=206008 RepID=UPI000DF4CC4A|nr:RING-H2 finger protein ATL79-like [Panicum hallii]
MERRANHTASPSMTKATAAAVIASSPSPPRPPPAAAGAWGPYASSRAFFSNVATILIILACVSLLAFALHAAARLVLRCLARRRAARVDEPKLPCSAADAAGAGVAAGAPGAAGEWGEAECAICLSELAGGGRVRVLPACGHGFHGACVEGWLAARASCPTCRAPSRAGEP